MICERCSTGRGDHICTLNPRVREARRRRLYHARESQVFSTWARYADELVHITQELRRAANVIEMVESEPALIGALMDSGDWRIDEITQLRRHVTDLRARIGNY